LSPDGTCIAAGCEGRGLPADIENEVGSYNIRIINLELVANLKIPHPYEPSGGGRIKLLKGEVWPSPFEGHMGDVYSAAYSADGKQIASGSNETTGQSRSGMSRLPVPVAREHSRQILIGFTLLHSLQKALK
jgi:hypothetical protein